MKINTNKAEEPENKPEEGPVEKPVTKYKCPNCANEFDTAKEKDKNYVPDNGPGYINIDKTGATCWRCNYSSEFAEESWNIEPSPSKKGIIEDKNNKLTNKNPSKTQDTTKPKKKEKKKEPTWKEMAEAVAKPFKFGTIVALFNKTKPLENDQSAFCPHFMQLKHASGCWYDCQWCYLLGTFGRWIPENDYTDPRRTVIKNGQYVPKIKPEKEVATYLEKALDTLDGPLLFNSGELSDSLVDRSMMLNTIIPIFAKYKDKGHKLLILTKSTDVSVIRAAMRYNAQEFVIISHSINSANVADIWELDCPEPINRIAASRHAADVGYETRIRIDPMVPEGQWRKGYQKLIEDLMRINPKVSVITLGTPRGLKGTIENGNKLKKDMRWTEHLTENSSWGKKIAKHKRIEMYEFAITELRRQGYERDIGLCKETVEVWGALRKAKIIEGYPGEEMCNCVLKAPGKPDYYKQRTFKPLEE